MKYLILVTMIVASGCTLTAPEGEKQLMEEIRADRERQNRSTNIYLGRPKMIKVRAYRQVVNGDVHGDHWIYLQVGRENLKIDDLIGE